MSIEKKLPKLMVILIVVSLLPHSAGDPHANAATQPFADDLISQAESQGALDTTFGDGGKVAIEVSPIQSTAKAVAVQPDGKLVAVGYANNASIDFAVVRFNADGTLDSSFGSGGRVTTDFFGDSDFASAVALQADERIVVAGYAGKTDPSHPRDFALVRYNSDGSLDATFGNGGKVTTGASGHSDSATSLVILPDGRFLVGGITSGESDDGDFKLVRYNANGALDTTFGDGGAVVTDFFGHFDRLAAIALQIDGKILGAGSTDLDSDGELEDFALVRYEPDGRLDHSFGTAGKVATDFFGFSTANAMALDGSGKIVVAGSANKGMVVSLDSFDFALARYNSDGSLDTSFGGAGKVTTDFAGNQDTATGVALQADGKILAGGYRNISSDTNTRDFALVRYNSDGTLDGTFGSNGKSTTDFAGLGDLANAMALQSDGKVILAGNSYHSTGPSTQLTFLSLARYIAGSPAAPGFSLSFDQSPITVQRGNAAKTQVLVSRTGGFSGDVTITPPDASADGIKVKPGAPESVSGGAVTFKLKIKPGAAVGNTALTFTGTDTSGHASTATLTVIVQ